MTVAATQCARTRRFSLFVLGFTVNDGGNAFARVFSNAFPYAHDVAASGINDLATAIFDLLQDGQLCPKSRKDHDVVGFQFGNVGLLMASGQIFDAERGDLLVDFRIVDNFPDNVEPAILKNFARSVGQIDSAFDAVAKAELLGQPHCDIAHRNETAVAPHFVHDIAAIM